MKVKKSYRTVYLTFFLGILILYTSIMWYFEQTATIGDSGNKIIAKRQTLIKFIWGDEGFPYSKIPTNVTINIKDSYYSELKNLERIDKIVIIMDYDINSIVYHFHPKVSNNKLIIYHHGHQGGFEESTDIIQFFLDKGYSVLAFSMPARGMNNQPIVQTNNPLREVVQLVDHNWFQFLTFNDNSSAIKFFVEPIAITLNYAEKFNYNSTSMVGVSGGGWTTVLYSAIDVRISKSYPVAASLPLELRNRSSLAEWGDWEQTLPGLYNYTANYTDLYILGSYGDGRKQLQIFNLYDPCCFGGNRSMYYLEYVKSILGQLGKGSFEIFLDDTHDAHKISDAALDIIINEELKSKNQLN